jgi:hypothetical protein
MKPNYSAWITATVSVTVVLHDKQVGKVFWHVTPYSLVENANASDKHSASIIRVELQQGRGSGVDTGREAKNWGL